MRCLNEDDKEQYKGDKNIITATLISDTVPEEFPHNGKYISNLTEDDILAPGSTLMILDGSGEIYMMKEGNFNPDNIIGRYEVVYNIGPGNQGTANISLIDSKGNIIDSTSVAYIAESGYEHTFPYVFHDIKLMQNGYENYELRLLVDDEATNIIYFDGVAKNPGDILLTVTRNQSYAWRDAGLLPKKLENDITSKTGATSTEWCKI